MNIRLTSKFVELSFRYPSNSGIADFRDIPNSINFGNGTVNSEMGKVDSVLFEDVFHPCESNERLL